MIRSPADILTTRCETIEDLRQAMEEQHADPAAIAMVACFHAALRTALGDCGEDAPDPADAAAPSPVTPEACLRHDAGEGRGEGITPPPQAEIGRLRTIIRVNGLRHGATDAEIDALLSGAPPPDSPPPESGPGMSAAIVPAPIAAPTPPPAPEMQAAPLADPPPRPPRAKTPAQMEAAKANMRAVGMRRSSLTEPRAELMRRMWPDPSKRISEIFTAYNALEGAPISKSAALYDIAHRLGMPRQRDSAAPPAPARPAPPPPAPRVAPAAPAAPPAMSPAEQARTLLRQGVREAAIQRQTGLSHEALAEIIAEEAARTDAALAAQQDRARALLAAGTDPADVVARTRLKLPVVLRLRAELREAARAEPAA